MKPVLVNLGCGSRYHPDWINFDIHSTVPEVRECNLLEGVPLPDNSCDAVYNAALLEHLPRREAERFLRECRRILRPGGILRIGVPDLEQIVRIYLGKLEGAVRGDATAQADYRWILLELLDQLTRTRSGGEMLAAVVSPEFNEQFVAQRIGDEYRTLRAAASGSKSRWARLRTMPFREIRHRLLSALGAGPRALRRGLATLILSRRDAQALRTGLFRASGEIHHWMYDRYSLISLLERSGFQNGIVQAFSVSQIDPDWLRYRLDADEEGRPLKPDLFFVECIKPYHDSNAAAPQINPTKT
jgi:predicted SAM-dependent methyltransferase